MQLCHPAWHRDPLPLGGLPVADRCDASLTEADFTLDEDSTIRRSDRIEESDSTGALERPPEPQGFDPRPRADRHADALAGVMKRSTPRAPRTWANRDVQDLSSPALPSDGSSRRT